MLIAFPSIRLQLMALSQGKNRSIGGMRGEKRSKAVGGAGNAREVVVDFAGRHFLGDLRRYGRQF
jgi:hypothetical protein